MRFSQWAQPPGVKPVRWRESAVAYLIHLDPNGKYNCDGASKIRIRITIKISIRIEGV